MSYEYSVRSTEYLYWGNRCDCDVDQFVPTYPLRPFPELFDSTNWRPSQLEGLIFAVFDFGFHHVLPVAVAVVAAVVFFRQSFWALLSWLLVVARHRWQVWQQQQRSHERASL